MMFSKRTWLFLAVLNKMAMGSKADQNIRGRRYLKTIDECIVEIADVQGDPNEEFRPGCADAEGTVWDIDGIDPTYLADAIKSGALAPGDVFPGLNGAAVGLDSKIASGSSRPGIEKRNDRANQRGGRRLATTGTRTVLAVMVTTSHTNVGDNIPNSYGNGQSWSANPRAQLKNDVFDDAVCLKSQYALCSHGKLTFDPMPDQDRITDGIVDITVDKASAETDSVVRPAVTNALVAEFGTASGLANHVMYCLPPGTMSGIAYAYINSWNSVYSNQWCNYVSGQLHEIGHNLGLGHSNEAGTYKDQTGFMGYSYSQDDQSMCFNPAKNWKLGWFNDNAVTVSSTGTKSYIGALKGQVNYAPGVGEDPVVIKIDDTASSMSYFVGFNHGVKHNSGTREAANLVTIQSRDGEGTAGYYGSELLAKLGAGGRWSITLADGEPAEVAVDTITTGLDDGAAQVTITVGPTGPTPPPTPAPTASPTKPPTPAPTASPTMKPTASPTLTFRPTSPPTPAPTGVPTTSPTSAPTRAPVPCTLAAVGELCGSAGNGGCCSGTCQTSGKPSNRMCTGTCDVAPTTQDGCAVCTNCAWSGNKNNGSCDCGAAGAEFCAGSGEGCSSDGECCGGSFCKGNGRCS